MFGSNTAESERNAHQSGRESGIEDVMIFLNELMNDTRFNEEERNTVKRVYRLASDEFPDNNGN
jgi:hypothetical protein